MKKEEASFQWDTSRCIEMIMKFKTTECKKKCSGENIEKCVCYHSEEERRRPPLDLHKKLILYSNLLDQEFLFTGKIYNLEDSLKQNAICSPDSQDVGDQKNKQRIGYCLNYFEYLYHVENYKSRRCQYETINGICSSRSCPYFHEGEDLRDFNQWRKGPLSSFSHLNTITNDLPSNIYVSPNKSVNKTSWKRKKNEKMNVATGREIIEEKLTDEEDKIQIQNTTHSAYPKQPHSLDKCDFEYGIFINYYFS